jgi:hypothetical protein
MNLSQKFAQAISRDEAKYHAEDTERGIWLDKRRHSIGASEGAMVLEQWDADEDRYVPMSEFGDGYQVWASKVKGYQIPETDGMRRGSYEEGYTAKKYRAEAGRPIGDPGATEIIYHPDYPVISCTLDRVQDPSQQNPAPEGCAGRGVLELKDLSPRWYPLWMKAEREYKWDPKTGRSELCLVPHSEPAEVWKISPPMQYQVQIQIQMACTGLQWGTLCGKFPGGEVVWVDIERSERFINWALPRLVTFWKRYIETETPPPVRDPRSLEIVQAIATDDGSTVPLDSETAARIQIWEWMRASKTELEKELSIHRAELINSLGGATWGEFGNRFLQYRKTKAGYRKLSVVRKRK